MAFLPLTAIIIRKLVNETLGLLVEIAELDNKRTQFTQTFVAEARKRYPDYNVVIIHTEHNREGIFIHQHEELYFLADIKSIGYEIYFSKIGDPFWLENLGDGGYINWAYDGYFERDGNRITAIVPARPGPTWQQLPGLATDIGVGSDGSVWMIGTNPVPGGFGIFHWNGSDWDSVDGGAVCIAVAPNGEPWVVDNAGKIFRSTDGKGGWDQLPGAATDIGVGSDGSVWIIGTKSVTDGFALAGNGIDTEGDRISVASDGSPWVVNNAGKIFRSTDGKGGWDQLPGAATDIGVGSDGSVWIIGTNPVPGGFGIFHWNGSAWNSVDGGAVCITVAPDGEPWVVNNGGTIFQGKGFK